MRQRLGFALAILLSGCVGQSDSQVGVKEYAAVFPPQPKCHPKNFTYNGGEVLGNPHIRPLFWGSPNNLAFGGAAPIDDFFAQIVGSDYYAWLSEYSAGGIQIGPGIAHPGVTGAPTNNGNTVSDADIEATIAQAFTNQVLPPPGLDAFLWVPVFLPTNITVVKANGDSSCGKFSAYHQAFDFNGISIPYGVIPEACVGSFGALTINVSHEMGEAITDPIPDQRIMGSAWQDVDSDCAEIGDQCEGQNTTATGTGGTQFSVQALWSDCQQQCVNSANTVPVSGPAMWMTWKSGTNNAIFATTQDANGGWFSQTIPRCDIGSDTGPAIVGFGKRVMMAWKGAGDPGIYFTTFDGQKWTPQQKIAGVGTSGRPALAVGPFDGKVYMVWKGSGDNSIWSTRFNPMTATWDPQSLIPGVGTSGAVALVPFNNTLFMAWKGSGDENIWFSSNGTGNAGDWAAQTNFNVGTSVGPTLAVFPSTNRIFMAWKGADNDTNIYWSISADGHNFSAQQQLAVGTDYGPSLSFNTLLGKMVMAWKGSNGDTHIYYSMTTDGINGNGWSAQSQILNSATTYGPSLAMATTVAFTGCTTSVNPDTIFSPGIEACPGRATWTSASSLCAPGWAPCTANQWMTETWGGSPTNNYWLADNLGWGGTSSACWASTTNLGNCGTNTPMRLCGAATDAQGNVCNWINCGLNRTSNDHFGGCSGDLTAGTLCCMSDPSIACALGSQAQAFAPGVVGCSGSVTWKQRNTLCGPHCKACDLNTYNYYQSLVSLTQPAFDYWLDSNVGWSGTGSNHCSIGNGTCATNNPMHVCVPNTTTDSLGNRCDWFNCGDSISNEYLGGCGSSDSTAGTLCCCDQ
jgi:hypothetical protein